MKNFVIISVVVITSLLAPDIVKCETIYLKSGKEISGTIVEQTEDYIKVDVSGIILTFFYDDIERIGSTVTVINNNDKLKIKTPDEILNDLIPSFYIQYTRKFFPQDGDLLCEGDVHLYKKNNKILIREIFTLSDRKTLICDNLFLYNADESIYIIDMKNKVGKEYPLDVLMSVHSQDDEGYRNFMRSILELKFFSANMLLKDVENIEELKQIDHILNKECITISSDKQMECVWNKIPLKMENSFRFLNRNYIDKIEAVVFNDNLAMPDETFRIPKDISCHKLTFSDSIALFQETKEDFQEASLGIYHLHIKDTILKLNEAKAILNLKKVLISLAKYIGTNKKHKFPTDLEELSKYVNIDSDLTIDYKDGYLFKYTPIIDEFGIRDQFILTAIPWEKTKSGNRSFFTDESGVIKEGIDGTGKIVDAQ